MIASLYQSASLFELNRLLLTRRHISRQKRLRRQFKRSEAFSSLALSEGNEESNAARPRYPAFASLLARDKLIAPAILSGRRLGNRQLSLLTLVFYWHSALRPGCFCCSS